MHELSFNILCLIGIICLLWRITIFLKTLLQLVWKSKSWVNKSTEDKISELCHCNFTVFGDSD